MRQNRPRAPSLAPILIVSLALAAAPPSQAAPSPEAPGARLFAELSAGPLFGLDRPLRGCSLDALVGLSLAPFEAGIGAAGAYDAALDSWDMRFDLELGLGSGLRAIVGGLLLWGEPALPDPGGGDARIASAASDWPNRFGIAATIAELPWRPLGAALGIDARLLYTSYRVEAKTALSGAAAFVAGVEAALGFRIRFETPRRRP
jgi:hypothetical protein